MFQKKSDYKQLSRLQKVLLTKNIPFASYRLPIDGEVITAVQHHSMPQCLHSLNDLHTKVGFIVSPFNALAKNGTYLLEPDDIFFSNNIDDILIEKLNENNHYTNQLKQPDNQNETTTIEDFISQVNLAMKAMENGDFHKVVLSKIRLENLDDSFDAPDFFLKLCSKYPHAFVYLLQLPDVGCWIGATPEPLISIVSNTVTTVSMAGTQIATNTAIDSYKWGTKEYEEQEIVTNFVEQTLHLLAVKNYSKVGPLNYQAANLIHLKTIFEFHPNELNGRLGDFIKALHPTPSVGGLPKTEAQNFILANEKHSRAYYSGFLGPINIDNRTDVFVNLRCMQLLDKQIILYSGAGITTSSVPQNEWQETNNKMMTLLNVINS